MRMTDKDALIKKFEEAVQYGQAHGMAEDVFLFGAFIAQLENETIAPTIEAEPVKHGKWTVEEVPLWIVKGEVVSTSIVCVCSACGRNADTKTKYCPNCGAKMDGGAENG